MSALASVPIEGSMFEYLADLEPVDRVELLGMLTDEDVAQLERERFDWKLYARLEQLPPSGYWRVWGIQAGRGGGKTRTAAQWVALQMDLYPGIRIGLFGPTSAKVREVMIEDVESGLMAVAPPHLKLEYQPTRLRITGANGSRCILYTADNPDRCRGANLHKAWADEVAEWPSEEAWTNLDMSLRKTKAGIQPQIVVTTTPRPTELIRTIFQGPKVEGKRTPVQWKVLRQATATLPAAFVAHPSSDTYVHRWSTYANSANLSEDFIRRMADKYAGTRLGRQELEAEILEDTPGALWSLAGLDAQRIAQVDAPRLDRLVISVDPSHSQDGTGDACGIIVVGLGGPKKHGYVKADRTLNASPNEWGLAAIRAYDDFRADLIVYEDNESPDRPSTVRDVIRTVDPKGRIKWHAIHSSRDKRTRADPVSALYEQGKVHHITSDKEDLSILEDEMCSWDPTSRFSPNRLDALVHALTYLMLGQPVGAPAGPVSITRPSPWRI